MAINRNIIEWSNTEKAFKAKSYIEIFNMLLENYRAIYGADIDLTVETAFGEELRMEAEQLYDFAKLAEDMYYTLDVNNASGAVLDNLVAFTSNLIRKTNIQTILIGSLKIADLGGAGNISLAPGNVIYVQDEYNILWRAELVNAETVPQELVVGATLLTAPSNEVRLTAASYGENLITANLTQLLVNGSYYSNDIQLDNIIYESIGSIEETDAMLRQRKNNTLSYNSKTLLDSIRDYILKNIYSVKDVLIYNANGRRTSDTNVDTAGNTLLPLLMNNGVVEEEVTLLKHDLLVLIQPQTGIAEQTDPLSSFRTIGTPDVPTSLSTAIAKVLQDKITPGIATAAELITWNTGTEAYDPIADATGYIEVILPVNLGSAEYNERYSFYVVNKYNPTITISLLTKNNYDPVTTQARIRQAIYDLSTSYTINQDIRLDEILTVVKNANIDVLNPTFTITGIAVGSGAAAELKVNNGYWLVDPVGLADWNIVINDGS